MGLNRTQVQLNVEVHTLGRPVTRLRPRDKARVRVNVAELCFALIDVAIVCSSGMFAFYVRFFSRRSPSFFSFTHGDPYGLSQYVGFFLLYAVLAIIACESQDLYRVFQHRSATDEVFAILNAMFLATLVLTVCIYLSGSINISRFVVGLGAGLDVIGFVGWRAIRRVYVSRRLAQGFGARNVLIVGAGEVGRALARHLQQNVGRLGFMVRGFLDSAETGDVPILGRPEDLAHVARAEFIDDVFITVPAERELVKEVVSEARRHRLDVHLVPELYDGLARGAGLAFVGDFPVLQLHQESIPTFGLLVKRTLDVVGSIVGLILLLPVFAVIAIAIRIDTAGPTFYGSRRVGSKGRTFTCYKFRTMVANAEQLKKELNHLNYRDGLLFKIADDPRITRVGRFLRKYSLDELPQLWNVLTGEMSLVGPRPLPITLDDLQQYNLEHLRRLDTTPGLTGLWQISARRDASFANCIALDLDYIENWSLWLDLKILLETIFVVAKGTGQ